MDITVKGAGIFGLSIAWICTRRGARVQVIDPAGIGKGASGGVLGALAPHTPDAWNEKKQFQLESLLMAEPFWRDVEEVVARASSYGRIGRLQPIQGERALSLAQTRMEAAAQNWPEHVAWQIRDNADWPALPYDRMVWDTLSARIDPARAIACLADALRSLGVPIRREGPELGHIVECTGHAGLTALSEQSGQEIGGPEKGQALRLRTHWPELPQLFIDGMHIIPHADGSVAIGSTSERQFEHVAPDIKADKLLMKAVNLLPWLRDAEIIERWAGLRPRARSRAPVLGAIPGHVNRFIANGGFKIGFGMAPKVAEVMADLVLDNRDTIPTQFRFDQLLG